MVKKGNHKIFNLIIMIFISIYMLGILNVSCAHEKVINYNDSYMVAEIIYGEEEQIKNDYVPTNKDDKNLKENPNEGKLWYRQNENELFQEVRKNVARWYYILRYVGMAVMLAILILIGIKLAISSVAEQKAIYKRMLEDWVVCFILFFLAHYFMIFVQFLNEHLIYIFEQVSHTISGTGEYSLYETVRSRAYDVKFTVGFTGMFLYIILVYLTCKYVLIYAKRFITIVILTIMAPIMFLLYGIQKIFTGRSKALSKWLGEYATNTLMQAVHAITYALFVGIALELAKQSLIGIIIAFIFLNFMTKADILFRQIFKFGDGSSLADENSQSKLSEIKDTFVGAYAAVSVVKKTPIGRWNDKVYGTAGRLVASPALKMASGIKNSKFGVAVGENAKILANNLATFNENRRNEKDRKQNDMFDSRINQIEQGIRNTEDLKKSQEQKGILTDEQKADFEKKIANLQSMKQNEENRKNAYNQKSKEKQDKRERRNNSARKAIFLKAAELLDPDSYLAAEIDENNSEIKKNIFGKPKRKLIKSTEIYNEETEKYERVGGFRNRVKDNADAIFNLSSDDKAVLKDMTQMAKDGVLGFGGMLLGMGSFVDNPTLGFALLASGTGKVRKISKEDTNGLKFSREMRKKIRKVQKENAKTFVNPQFTTGTILSMDDIIKDLAITDPSIAQINHLRTLIDNNNLKYAVPMLPYLLTGTKGVPLNLLLKLRKAQEQNIKNIKKYEVTVNVELAKRLRKEISEQMKVVCENISTHVMHKDIVRLIQEKRLKDGTLFSADGNLFAFNSKENNWLNDLKIKQSILDIAFSNNIYNLEDLELNNPIIKQAIIDTLNNQGIFIKTDDEFDKIVQSQFDEMKDGEIGKLQEDFKNRMIIDKVLADTALKFNIETFDRFNLNDLYIKSEIIDELKNYGIDIQTNEQFDYIIKYEFSKLEELGETRIQVASNKQIADSMSLIKDKIYEKVQYEYEENMRIEQAIVETALERNIFYLDKLDFNDKKIKKVLKQKLKDTAAVTQKEVASDTLVDRIINGETNGANSKLQIVLERLIKEKPNVIKEKLYQQTVIEYMKKHSLEINNVKELSSPAVRKAIDNAYCGKLRYNQLDTDIKANILFVALQNDKKIKEVTHDEIVAMISDQNPRALFLLEEQIKAKKDPKETIERAIEIKQKQISDFMNDLVIGAMINNKIKNPLGVNLKDNNEPQVQSLKVDLINLFKFSYKESKDMDFEDDDLLKIMQNQINSLTKEEVEEAVTRNVYATFVKEKCDGDVSKLSEPEIKKQLTEEIIQTLSDFAETEEEKGDIANVLEVLDGKKPKKKTEVEVEKSVASTNTMFSVTDNDDADKDKDLSEDLPLPVVTTKVVDEKIICTFDLPSGLGDEYKLETCWKSSTNSKEVYLGVTTRTLNNEDEIVCARITKDGKHGHSLVVKYPTDALNIVKKMHAAQKQEEKQRDEEKANNVEKVSMKVLDSITKIDENSSIEDVVGLEYSQVLDDDKNSYVDIIFKEFEIKKATNKIIALADEIRDKKVKIGKKTDEAKAKVAKMMDEALDEVDDITGIKFSSDEFDPDAEDIYNNYKESADDLLKKLLQMKMIDEDNDKLEIKNYYEKNQAYIKINQEYENDLKVYDVTEILNSIHQKKGV